MAKELGVPSKDLLARLEELGSPASSHSSSIDEGTADRLRAEFGNGGAANPAVRPQEEASTPPPAPADAPAEPATKEPVAEKKEPIEEKKPSRFRKRAAARSRRARILTQIAELPLLILVAFLIAVVIKTFLMQAFYIPSGSMKPTLQIGDRVLVEKISYLLGRPTQGDVIVFSRSVLVGPNEPDLPWYRDVQNYVRELLGLPTGKEEDYIKRVVATGGESVRYEGTPRRLYINGERAEEEYLEREDNGSTTITSRNCPAKMESTDDGCLVPAGNVFVMGDNRDNSADSRSIGPIDEEEVVGRAFVVIWPIGDFGGL